MAETSSTYKKPTLWGNLKKIFYNPCALSPYVQVEVAAATMMRLFWTYKTPVWKTFVKDVSDESWLCNARSMAHAVEESKPTWQSKLRRFVFKIDAKIDQGMFWWFVASLAEEGLINYTSSLLKGQACSKAHWYHRGQGQQAIGGWPGGDPDRWLENIVWRNTDWPDTPQAVSAIQLGPGESGWISGGAWFTTPTNMPLPASSRVIIEETGEVLDHDDIGEKTIESDGTTTSWAKYWNDSYYTRTMRWQAKVWVPTYGTQIVTNLGGHGSSGHFYGSW